MPRPFSPIRLALAAELVAGPGTCADLARRVGCEWPVLMVRLTLRNMVAAGEVSNDESVRLPGVRRPVPVYRRAQEPASSGAGIRDLIACWAGQPVVQRGGCSMQ